MARTLASAWVNISPAGFADFAKKAKAGITTALKGTSANVPINADTVPAVAGIDKLKLKLAELSKTVTDARVGLDDKQANAAYAALGVKLDVLSRRVATPKITLEGVAKAEADILALDVSLDKLNAKTAGSGGGGGLLSRIIPGLGGGGGGAAGAAGSAGTSGTPLLGALGGPGILTAVTAGLLALPFAAQVAGGGIVAALGGGLAALGIAGALAGKGGTTAKASAQQVTAAQDGLRAAQLRLVSSQDKLNKLQGSGKTTASQLAAAQAGLASAQGSVASAQDRLNKLQAAAAGQQANKARQAFSTLSSDAKTSLATIGVSFVPVMQSIFDTADRVLKKMAPLFAGAVKIISGPFKVFGDALITAFGTPAVKTSIQAVATAFAAILKAVTPGLATDIGQVATGITKIAQAVTANPKAFSDFIGFLAATVGGVLTAIAALFRFASYIEAHFIPVFDGARHEIAHVWDDIASNTIDIWDKIWTQTIGRAIQGGHDIEDAFNNLKNWIWNDFLLKIFDFFTKTLPSWWDTTVNFVKTRLVAPFENAVTGAVNTVVRFFQQLPGKVTSALGVAGKLLLSWGAGVITGLLTGMNSVITQVWNFIKGIPGKILHFLGINSPPQWAIDAGKHIMNGLGIGITQAQGKFQKASSAAAAAAAKAATGAFGGGSGPVSADAASAQRYAASRLGAYGWAANQIIPLIALWNQESGWNRFAYNASSGATGIPQSLPFSKMPRAAWLPSQGGQASAGAQVDWGLGYIRSVYGSPAGAEAHEQAFNWYAGGVDAVFGRPTIIGVGEAGPERVQVLPWHGPGSAGQAGTSVHVSFEVGSTGNKDFDTVMLTWLRKNVQVKGGGSVQKAFGTGRV